MKKEELVEYAELLLDRIRNERFRELDEKYHSDPAITKIAESLKDEPLG